MAGSGTRLGMPFHKALSPTLTPDGILPLYAHARRRLDMVARETMMVISPEMTRDPCLRDLPGTLVVKEAQGELPSSLAFAARNLAPDTLCAVALPDSIWYPVDGFARLVAALATGPARVRCVLGLFSGSSHVLDEVTVVDGWVSAVTRHDAPPVPERTVDGWGCLIARADLLAGLADDRPLGPQLGAADCQAVHLEGPYVDLGTPERYGRDMDLPVRIGHRPALSVRSLDERRQRPIDTARRSRRPPAVVTFRPPILGGGPPSAA